MKWVDYVRQALEELGGVAHLNDIYRKIESIHDEPLSDTWQNTVRRTLQQHSSDTRTYRHSYADLFQSADGLHQGVWALRETQEQHAPFAEPEDVHLFEQTQSEIPAPRVNVTQQRIIRDTRLARWVKGLYGGHCQICDYVIQLPNDSFYAEAHHVKPLGNPHHGPDITPNILCLCPNHHAEVDYGVIRLTLSQLKQDPRHSIDERFLAYHNTTIYGR